MTERDARANAIGRAGVGHAGEIATHTKAAGQNATHTTRAGEILTHTTPVGENRIRTSRHTEQQRSNRLKHISVRHIAPTDISQCVAQDASTQACVRMNEILAHTVRMNAVLAHKPRINVAFAHEARMSADFAHAARIGADFARSNRVPVRQKLVSVRDAKARGLGWVTSCRGASLRPLARYAR